MEPLFIATEVFNKTCETWEGYIEFSGLTHVEEIVGLDCSLSPSIIDVNIEEDYKYLPEVPLISGIYNNLEFVKSHIDENVESNLLLIYRKPSNSVESEVPGFTFLGYELIEEDTFTSAITNCGGFPESFSNSELNEFGLISEFDRASQICINLKINNPFEAHAETELYAIFRFSDKPF
jgi:hypothetical protein